MALLEVKNLSVEFGSGDSRVMAVRNNSFNLEKGKTLGIVGESGCGKSVSAFSILQLISAPGKITSGEIFYKGEDLLKKTEDDIV
jgi:ABC-type dipeptide/oligopeptide/nickel transport system ATPase component